MLGFGHLYFNWEEYGKKYAEDYYDKGGNMQPYVPQEMRSEYVSLLFTPGSDPFCRLRRSNEI